MQSIPKGLTIGYDHWADMTPEGMARAALRNDGSDDYRQMVAEAMPNATEEETIKWLKEHFEGILSSVPIVVNSVCACSSFHLYALTVNVCLGSSQGR